MVERHRLAAAAEARLRQAALALLAAGRADTALAYASGAVARNPLEEGNHELLVRSLAAAGDRAAALRQVLVGEDVLRRELGIKASPALREAADSAVGSPVGPPFSGRAAAASQLDAGRAAIAAGAVQAGVDCLRRACAEAAACGDPALQARALVALGSALVHAVRGRDEEGAAVLHEAIRLASEAGDRETAVTAHRELGFVDVEAGRRQTAAAWLAKAEALASTDDELASILGVRGMNASDMGDYPSAFQHLHGSIERARRCANYRQEAWSLATLARAHLLRDERSQAVAALARSLELVHAEHWMAFLPYPEALKGELDLLAGHTDTATDELEHAFALACQLGDPCWEAMAARGLGDPARWHQLGCSAPAWTTPPSTDCSTIPTEHASTEQTALLTDDHVTEGLAAIDPASDSDEKDVPSSSPGYRVALVVDTQANFKQIVAALANTNPGDPDPWGFTLIHPLGPDSEVRATQPADRHSISVGDRNDNRHRIAVACGGDALACSRRRRAPRLNDQAPHLIDPPLPPDYRRY